MVSGKNEVELKGGMYAFISLRLHTSDIDAIDQQIADKVQQAPTFFKGTPVVVDLTPLEEEFEGSADLDTGALLERIRAHDLVPIVANVSDKSSPLALSIDIPLIERGAKQSQVTSGIVPAEDKPDHQSESTQGTPAQPLPALAPEVQFVVVAPMLIDKPVRSGQQIFARDTDLVVVSSAAAGSELIADNNIHVYGPLRGRALCGVSGNTNARIFCQSLEAEIVSVAGNYRLLEEIPEDLRGKPAQIWLDGDRLNIESV